MDGSESSRIAAPTSAPPPPARRTSWKRLGVVLGAWVIVAGGAFALAAALDSEPEPVCEGSAPGGLEPLRLYLDRPALPADIAALPTAAEQIRALEDRANQTDEPERWVEIGIVAQRLEDRATARRSFERALAVDPDSLEAKVGQATLECATNPDALARAERTLARLESENPDRQLVAFNRGIVAAYRRDLPGFTRAFRRTVELGSDTELGTLAGQLLGAAEPARP
jgi:tetratricopeptide (TPR) repeat protein